MRQEFTSDLARDLRLALFILESGLPEDQALCALIKNWASPAVRPLIDALRRGDANGDAEIDALERRFNARERRSGDSASPDATATYAAPRGEIGAQQSSDPRSDSPPGPLGAAVRFEVLELHAHGGLGEVYIAFDCELKRRVALKKLRSQSRERRRCAGAISR